MLTDAPPLSCGRSHEINLFGKPFWDRSNHWGASAETCAAESCEGRRKSENDVQFRPPPPI